MNNQQLTADNVADPAAFGDRDEVLDALGAAATADAVIDDTAFGAMPIRSGWNNTLFGTNSTFKTWAT